MIPKMLRVRVDVLWKAYTHGVCTLEKHAWNSGLIVYVLWEINPTKAACLCECTMTDSKQLDRAHDVCTGGGSGL